jgi:hypothetical protein
MKPLATVVAVQALVIGALLTIALDQYAHKRVETVGGVNTWGYRGPVARQKQPNEVRIGIVGGSLAYGWGVAASETVVTEVRRLVALVLDVPGKPAVVVSAFNLAAAGLPPAGFVSRVRALADLHLDVVCVYPDPAGYAKGPFLPPADSLITAKTGYTPMLPLVLTEKGGPAAMVGRTLRLLDRTAYRALRGDSFAPVDDVVALRMAMAELGDVVPRLVLVLPAPGLGADSAGFERLTDAQPDTVPAAVRIVDLSRDPTLHEGQLRIDQLNFGVAGHARAAEHIAPAVLASLGDVTR